MQTAQLEECDKRKSQELKLPAQEESHSWPSGRVGEQGPMSRVGDQSQTAEAQKLEDRAPCPRLGLSVFTTPECVGNGGEMLLWTQGEQTDIGVPAEQVWKLLQALAKDTDGRGDGGPLGGVWLGPCDQTPVRS